MMSYMGPTSPPSPTSPTATTRPPQPTTATRARPDSRHTRRRDDGRPADSDPDSKHTGGARTTTSTNAISTRSSKPSPPPTRARLDDGHQTQPHAAQTISMSRKQVLALLALLTMPWSCCRTEYQNQHGEGQG